MKKILSLLAAFGVMFYLSSCGDDDDGGDPTFDVPTVTAPTATADALVGNDITITFDVATAAGYKSASATATGGSATITSEPAAGETSGEVVVSFTAGTTIGAGSVILTVTDDADEADDATAALNVTNVLSGNIEEDVTLSNDIIWEISGRVFVTNDATLTIEKGSIIKGKSGIGSNASVLTIARDGMIEAVGTAAEPIIFTSVADDIALGETKGSNLDQGDNQLWGGLVILGNAPISPDAGTEAQIEGVPASEPLGLYGGTDGADNRGTLKYVSIRHGGTTIDPAKGNDINGLTLGGVGSGTEISHIEIIANFDDGVEFFGGAVSITNLLIYGVGDDAIDVDQAWSGTVDNFWVFTSDEAGSDEGLEIDGPEGSENSSGKFTLKNGTITSVDGAGSAADFKSKAQGTVTNVKWTGFTGGAKIKFRASFDKDNACADKTDAYTNLIGGDLAFATVEFTSISVYDGDDSDACDVPASYQTNAAAEVASETATGASDATIWDAWTLSAGLTLL